MRRRVLITHTTGGEHKSQVWQDTYTKCKLSTNEEDLSTYPRRKKNTWHTFTPLYFLSNLLYWFAMQTLRIWALCPMPVVAFPDCHYIKMHCRTLVWMHLYSVLDQCANTVIWLIAVSTLRNTLVYPLFTFDLAAIASCEMEIFKVGKKSKLLLWPWKTHFLRRHC